MQTSPRRPRFAIACAAVLCSVLCLTAPAAAQPPGPAATPDWNALDTEALDYYRHYLQIDTSNPPGDTTGAIAYLKGILDKEGIATETYAESAGKMNLIARLPGPAGVKPLLLMSHADVVPASAAQWSHPPFSADLAGGYVYARGSIDNKAHGIMALMTMLVLKRRSVALKRGVEMMVNPEEEVGGRRGAQWMVANHFDAIDPAFAFNEGGEGVPHWLGSSGVTFRVSVGEKRVMWLRLTAHGRAGHGSRPTPDNPNLILIDALQRLLVQQPPIRLIPVVRQLMETVAPKMPFPSSFELAHLNWPPVMRLALDGPLADVNVQPLLHDTITPTSLAAGGSPNVIPSVAQATIDCRLLPGSDSQAALDRITRLLGDSRISVEFIQKPDLGSLSPANGPAWDAIKNVVARDFRGAAAAPSMTAGGTDSRFLRERGVPAYGFVPIVLDDSDASRMHGVDERLSVENLNRGVRATYDLAIELCAAGR